MCFFFFILLCRGKLAKAVVFNGRKEKTVGGLHKNQLMKNKRGCLGGLRLGVERFDFGAQNTWSGLRSQEFVRRGLALNLWGGWQQIELNSVLFEGFAGSLPKSFLGEQGSP